MAEWFFDHSEPQKTTLPLTRVVFRPLCKSDFAHHFQRHKMNRPPVRPSPLRGNASASAQFKGKGFAPCSPCSQPSLRSRCCAWVRAALDLVRSGRCVSFVGDGRTGGSRLLLRGGSGPRVVTLLRSPVSPSEAFEPSSPAATPQKGSVALSTRMPSPIPHPEWGDGRKAFG